MARLLRTHVWVVAANLRAVSKTDKLHSLHSGLVKLRGILKPNLAIGFEFPKLPLKKSQWNTICIYLYHFVTMETYLCIFVSLCDNGNFIGTTFSIISPLPVGTKPPLPHLQDCSSALGNAVAIFSPTSGSNAKMTRAKSSKGNSSMIHSAQVKQMHGGKVCHFEFSHVSMVVLNECCFLFHVATGCCSDPNLSCIVIALLGIMCTSPGDSNSYATGLPGNWCVAAHMANASILFLAVCFKTSSCFSPTFQAQWMWMAWTQHEAAISRNRLIFLECEGTKTFQNINFHGNFHYKPSIRGIPPFMEAPIWPTVHDSSWRNTLPEHPGPLLVQVGSLRKLYTPSDLEGLSLPTISIDHSPG